MIASAIQKAFRSLRQNKVYSLINIVGLGVASAFIILVALFVLHASRMDTFSANTKNIYRVEMTDLWSFSVNKKANGFLDNLLKSAAEKNQVTTPLVLAGDLKKNFTEVKNTTRLSAGYAPVIRINNQSFKEEGKRVAEIDENFFRFMGLPLAQGNVDKPFTNKSSAVITESMAKKYFGSANPIGQTFSYNENENQSYTISAVAKDFPTNSSLQFDIMMPIEGNPYYEKQLSRGVNTMGHITLVELAEGIDLPAFQKRLNAFGGPYFKSFVDDIKAYAEGATEVKFNVSVRPLEQAHYNTSSPWPYYTDLKSVIQLSLLALIALGIACLNYVLLSLSRVAARSQEAGIRKTMGASWQQVVQLFLTETWVMVSIALLLGFFLSIIALPYFNTLTNISILSAELFQWPVFFFLLGLSFVLTLLAGIYPAFKMAGISALNMMRKFSTYKLNPSLSKLFLTLQYTACVVLIVFAIVIAQQMKFIYSKDIGFDKEQVLFVENPFRENVEKTVSLRDKMMNYANSQTAFTGFTGVGHRYAQGYNMNGHVINDKREYIAEMRIDYNYFAFHKISIVKGRDFSPDFKIDTSRQEFPKDAMDSTSSSTSSNIVVNETLYKMLGNPELGVINRSMGSIIVGVCKDYAYMGATNKIGPAYHICRPKSDGYFEMKIGKGQDMSAVMDKLKTEWNAATNNEPFSYSFLDQDVNKLYEALERWMHIINSASWLAIFIACLGLFGLSAVMAANRTKEMGIRKILGAGLPQLFFALNKTTFLLVLLSIVIAIPVANYIAKDWLESFAFRIHLHWGIFLIGGLIGLVCAIVSVSFYTMKVVKANPVESLRTE
jgi:putative ABC transport system permease protein